MPQVSDDDKPKKMGGILIIGPHHWGWGEDLDTAKKELRKAGGRLTDGYIIYVMLPTIEFLYVDNYGSVNYQPPPGWGEDIETGPMPEPWANKIYVKGKMTR